MDVLFLILNYKTYNETIFLTKELLKATTTFHYGVLIVDNCSPNESYKRIKESFKGILKVEVVSSGENGGYARGNNFGLRYAKKYSPEYVCIINNDVHFSMSTIESLCKWYELLPNAGFIAPKQMLPNGKEASFRVLDVPTLKDDIDLYNPFSRKKHIYTENCGISNVQEVGIIPGAFIFTRYEVFRRLGFFDESTFLFCEERFIAMKAKEAGLKNYIVLSENYLHNHSTTISKEASAKKQRRLIYEGRSLFHERYSKKPKLAKICLLLCYFFNESYCYALNIGKNLKRKCS